MIPAAARGTFHLVERPEAVTIPMLPDPRRPGIPLALVRCWCGRAYTLTPEAAERHATEGTPPCPEDCGRGVE